MPSGRIVAVAVGPFGQEFPVTIRGNVAVGKERFPLKTHEKGQCAGEFCPLHNPSNHPLRDNDMILRLDKDAVIERVCDHGVGHDDPDSMAYLAENGPDYWRGEYAGTHGCDGCCR